MEHLVYLDYKSNEFDKLKSGEKTMIIRGAAGRKLPYGRVNAGDTLYFINNNAEGLIKAKAFAKSVIHSDKMTPVESEEFVKKHQDKLCLTPAQFKRWAGKRYIVLVEVERFTQIDALHFNKENLKNMDDWRVCENISEVLKD